MLGFCFGVTNHETRITNHGFYRSLPQPAGRPGTPPPGVYSRAVLFSTGKTGRVVKTPAPGSDSRAMTVNDPAPAVNNPPSPAVNNPPPVSAQRSDPEKSDRSVAGNAWSIVQDDCPLAARVIIATSRRRPSRSNSQRTNLELPSRLWMATAVLIPPSRRRTGKMASPMGSPAPATASPMWGRSKRSIPPRRLSETTRTDPVRSGPRPWVEIVSSVSGSISVRTVSPPSC